MEKRHWKTKLVSNSRCTQGRSSESGKVPLASFYVLADCLGERRKLKLSLWECYMECNKCWISSHGRRNLLTFLSVRRYCTAVQEYQLSRHPKVRIAWSLYPGGRTAAVQWTLLPEQHERRFFFWQWGKIGSSWKGRSHAASLQHKTPLSLRLRFSHTLLKHHHFLRRLISPGSVLAASSRLSSWCLFLCWVRESIPVFLLFLTGAAVSIKKGGWRSENWSRSFWERVAGAAAR